ncbi:MAG: PRC-barrel domain-containing protein [Rhodospirillaceae bacterium]
MIFTRTTLLSAVSAVALMAAGPALAQSGANSNQNTNMERQSGAQTQTTTGTQTTMKADDIIGEDVKNAAGEDIGEVDSVIIDENGEVAAVVVSVGGFLGIGARNVAIDWSQIQMQPEGELVGASLTKEQLKAMPEYEYSDTAQRNTAFSDRTYLGSRSAGSTADRSTAGTDRSMSGTDRSMSGTDRSMSRTDRASGTAGTAAADDRWVPADVEPSALVGKNVVNAEGDTIGEVENVLTIDGKTALVVSVGEFLGIGGRDIAISLDQAKVERQSDDRDDMRVRVSMTKEQLEAMPAHRVTSN